jgi:CDP-2,3-bis-(O-geranylgeranyl)-sn-glycerol synthase
MHLTEVLYATVLIMVANGAPIVAKRAFGRRLARPLDNGTRFIDGRPLFGRSKTLRGLLSALALTTACAPLLGFPWQVGALVAAAAMAGDLLSSFVKRRLGLPGSSRAPGLDQIPESLFPLLASRRLLDLSAIDILLGVAIFFVGEVFLSKVFYRLGLRERPY